MSTQTTNEYLLLFRGSSWDGGLSPEQLEKTMNQVKAWFDRLGQEGVVKAGQPLEHEGRIVSGKNGRIVSDGPFAESKEAIGGYLLVHANSLEAATAIARQCPILEFGGAVEVRPIADECPTFRRVKDRLAHAA